MPVTWQYTKVIFYLFHLLFPCMFLYEGLGLGDSAALLLLFSIHLHFHHFPMSHFFCGIQLSVVLPVPLLQRAFFSDRRSDLLYLNLYFQPKNSPLFFVFFCHSPVCECLFFSSSASFIIIVLARFLHLQGKFLHFLKGYGNSI